MGPQSTFDSGSVVLRDLLALLVLSSAGLGQLFDRMGRKKKKKEDNLSEKEWKI